MKPKITPPLDWQPMPKNLRYTGWNRKRKFVSDFIVPVRRMMERGQIEVKFVVKNHKYPDPRNHYQWRVKQGVLL